ncbi:GNAT family N-acetyltransferase [Emticicia sp. BO119]|uniref:GNAT family N-acetyltransferase n=1 Tax=Emticicia sp. BO119 TaxID=2757768 RepID=UPI0015F11FBA|nr:GNAT family N-acetyltransferase [Emticicia sp. BO119]MBA4850665.1 GNAT family N-acetyltransferase [Emticicia sp. BO119]
MKNFTNSVLRFLLGLKRPSSSANKSLLHKNGETLSSFIIREAVAKDLEDLVTLYIQTWYETYGSSKHKLSRDYIHRHWKEFFSRTNEGWFCFVIENIRTHQLIGYAKAKPYSSGDLPDYAGELNKIYVLRNYQRLGLGAKLVEHVVRRFLDNGIHTMVLFGIPQNPSCGFHEAMGGKRLYAANRQFHGGYGWKDLREFAERRLI